jgi:hypothetical protein
VPRFEGVCSHVWMVYETRRFRSLRGSERNGDVSPVFENAAWIARDEGWRWQTAPEFCHPRSSAAVLRVTRFVATATKLARILLGCESLDDIAKDHVTHSDRRADDSGQKKVQTADDR